MRKDRLEYGIQIVRRLEASGVGDALQPDALYRLEMQCRWRELGTAISDDGFIACVGGFFTLDPEFQAQGLTQYEDPDFECDAFIPRFDGAEDFEALARFFEIDPHQAGHIFGGECTSLFNHAVERIQNVLDELPNPMLRDIRLGQWRQLELLLHQAGRHEDYHALLPEELVA